MSRPPLFMLALAASALALPPSAAAQSRREMQMMADIRIVQEQNQQLQIALAQLGDALKTINGRFDEQANASRKAFADQKLIVDQLAGDLRVVRERVDETNVRISSLSQELEGLRVSIPQYAPPPPSDTQTGIPAGPGPTSSGSAVPGDVGPQMPPPGLGVSPQRLFDTAWADYTSGQWALCVTGFDTYLRTFPRSELAGNAQFFIGECLASDGKFAEAVDAYSRAITGYPRAERIPDAYYKRGLALERLNELDRARESYEGAVSNFPESAPARMSTQRLDSLRRTKPPR